MVTPKGSISIDRESVQFFCVLGAVVYLQVSPLGGSRDETWRGQGIRKRSVSWNLPKPSQLWRCNGGFGNLRCTVTIDSVWANSKIENAFLFPVPSMFRHYCPLAVKTGSRPRRLGHKQNFERFSAYWYAPLRHDHTGGCTAEVGNPGGTYELPCTINSCHMMQLILHSLLGHGICSYSLILQKTLQLEYLYIPQPPRQLM
jgi:hypothetical protein